MVKLRSLAWSLWALAFIIIAITIVTSVFTWIYIVISESSNFLYSFFFWPLDLIPSYGLLGYFGAFAWWCFLIGFV